MRGKLAAAIPLLRSVYFTIEGYRSDNAFAELMRDCRDLLPDEDAGFNRVNNNNDRGSKCKIKPKERFGDFILHESSGIYQRNDNINNDGENECKGLYFEIIDLVLELFNV